MSAVSQKLARVLLGLYPEAWRERYRSEVSALVEDDPPGVRGLASLLVERPTRTCDPHAVCASRRRR